MSGPGQIAMVSSPMNDAAQQALAITEENLKAAFEHARNLMNARDINEVMQLQTEFLRNQFGIATEQSKQMSGGIASPGGDVAKEESDQIQQLTPPRFIATVIVLAYCLLWVKLGRTQYEHISSALLPNSDI